MLQHIIDMQKYLAILKIDFKVNSELCFPRDSVANFYTICLRYTASQFSSKKTLRNTKLGKAEFKDINLDNQTENCTLRQLVRWCCIQSLFLIQLYISIHKRILQKQLTRIHLRYQVALNKVDTKKISYVDTCNNLHLKIYTCKNLYL